MLNTQTGPEFSHSKPEFVSACALEPRRVLGLFANCTAQDAGGTKEMNEERDSRTEVVARESSREGGAHDCC